MSIVSASPHTLIRYADIASQLNDHLNAQAGTLAQAISHFTATCTEFGTSVDGGLAAQLHAYSRDVQVGDERVRQVGLAFARADHGAWLAFPATLAQLLYQRGATAMRLVRQVADWFRMGARQIAAQAFTALRRSALPLIQLFRRGLSATISWVARTSKQAQNWLRSAGNQLASIHQTASAGMRVWAHQAITRASTTLRGAAGKAWLTATNASAWTQHAGSMALGIIAKALSTPHPRYQLVGAIARRLNGTTGRPAISLGTVSKDVERVLSWTGKLSEHRRIVHSALLAGARLANRLPSGPGNVGKVKEAYKIFAHQLPNNSLITRQLNNGVIPGVVGVLAGITNDIEGNKYGGDRAKIVGVNVLDGITGAVIEKNPYGMAVLAINDIAQYGATVQEGIQRTLYQWIPNGASLASDADRVRGARAHMDLRDIITEFSVAIYEENSARVAAFEVAVKHPSIESILKLGPYLSPTVLSTPEGQAGSWKTIKTAANVVDGYVDYALATRTSISNIGINLSTTTIMAMPISPQLKSAIQRSADDQIAANQQIAEAATRLVAIKP